MQIKDERTITVPVPASANQSAELAGFVAQCHQQGYVLIRATSLQEGQRDPVTVGLRLTYRKGGVPTK